MKKVHALIQARTGARRLPNKVLLNLKGKTVLEHVIDRVRAANSVAEAVVVTTCGREDLKIVELVSRLGVRVLCGSQEDVLDRYYQAARLLGATNVARITADCPVMDPAVIDQVADAYFSSGADYCSNALTQTFPDGLDVEVFTFGALKKAWQNARLSSEREHVTPYIRQHKRQFKIVSLENPGRLGHYRWTLDEQKDYEFLTKLYDGLYRSNPLFGMDDILRFLQRKPELTRINDSIERNQGYIRSLKNDKVMSRG